MQEHTPGPWEHGSRGNARFVVYAGKDGHGRAICVMRNTQAAEPDHPLNLVADANARFIVQACNAHDKLLEALKALVEAHDQDPPMLTSIEWENARAVLAEAE